MRWSPHHWMFPRWAGCWIISSGLPFPTTGWRSWSFQVPFNQDYSMILGKTVENARLTHLYSFFPPYLKWIHCYICIWNFQLCFYICHSCTCQGTLYIHWYLGIQTNKWIKNKEFRHSKAQRYMELTEISCSCLQIEQSIKAKLWVRGDILGHLTEGEMFPCLLDCSCFICFTIHKPVIRSLCLSAVKETQWYSVSWNSGMCIVLKPPLWQNQYSGIPKPACKICNYYLVDLVWFLNWDCQSFIWSSVLKTVFFLP